MAKSIIKAGWKPLPKPKRRTKPDGLRHRKKLGPKSHLRKR